MRLTVDAQIMRDGYLELHWRLDYGDHEHRFTQINPIDMLESGWDYIMRSASKTLKQAVLEQRSETENA